MVLFLAILNSIFFTPFLLTILLFQAIVYIPIIVLTKNKIIRRYLFNNLIATDQACNALYGGDPDETISSRIGKDQDSNMIAKWVSRMLDLLQRDHVGISREDDEGKDRVL